MDDNVDRPVPKQQNLAKKSVTRAAGTAPALAKSELVDAVTRRRLIDEVSNTLRKREPEEEQVAGALRVLSRHSHDLRTVLYQAAEELLEKRAFDRPLWSAAIRTLSEQGDPRAAKLLREALPLDGGGPATLAAAGFCKDPSLAPILSKLASTRQSYLAFSADIARVARGESNGSLLVSIAPMIKESHRISICSDFFLGFTRTEPLPKSIGPALSILRSAERHLGRWLVFADVAIKAGDLSPLLDADQKSKTGASSGRLGWALVAWALAELAGKKDWPKASRPTLEVLARLSDRPSADRDLTFLFRMGRVGEATARPVLEMSLARSSREDTAPAPPLAVLRPLAKTQAGLDAVGIRAAYYLAQNYGVRELVPQLEEAALRGKDESLRGLAAAALWDLGETESARLAADEQVTSRSLPSFIWGALVRMLDDQKKRVGAFPLLTETHFRWVQCGWVE